MKTLIPYSGSKQTRILIKEKEILFLVKFEGRAFVISFDFKVITPLWSGRVTEVLPEKFSGLEQGRLVDFDSVLSGFARGEPIQSLIT